MDFHKKNKHNTEKAEDVKTSEDATTEKAEDVKVVEKVIKTTVPIQKGVDKNGNRSFF